MRETIQWAGLRPTPQIDRFWFKSVYFKEPGFENVSNYLILIVVGWIVGGFIEEMLFRGFLITRISNWFKNHSALGDAVAIAFTSAPFGFSHLYQG